MVYTFQHAEFSRCSPEHRYTTLAGSDLLDFEHIVQVNDLSNTKIPIMSREQLWQGLVLRAQFPQKFNAALNCDSTEIEANQFTRRITAGDAEFVEQVVLHPESKIETRTASGLNQIHAQSTTQIEEPESNSLFVRFSYQRDLETSDDSINIAEYLKSAYVQLDRDAIALIRMLAHSETQTSALN